MMLRFNPKSYKFIFFLLFTFALMVRASYFIEFRKNPYFDYIHPSLDSIVVHKGAIDICQGDLLLSKKGNRYPFYTYFVAAIYFLGSQKIYGVWIAQFILGALASALLFLIGTRLFNKKVGVIAALFYAIYGQNLFYEGVMLRAALTEFLAILSCYLLLKLEDKLSYGNLMLSSITLSAMIQCRPNTILVLPVVLIYLCFRVLRKEVLKKRLNYLTTFIFVLVVIGTPLLIRGMSVEKQFQFYDPSGPSVFLMGNLVDYDGLGWHWGSPRYRALKKTYDYEVSHDYVWVLKRIIKEMIDHPLGFISLYGRKTYYFFNNYEIPSNNNFYIHQRFSYLLKSPLNNFSLVVSLALLGMIVTLKDYKNQLLLYLFLLGMTGSVLLFYNVSRFRITTVPFYLIFSSGGVYALYQFIMSKQYVRFTLAVVLIIGLTLFLKTPNFQKIRENDYSLLADIYYEKGLYNEAISENRKALVINPNYELAYNTIGAALDKKGQTDEAIVEYKKALAINPNYTKALNNLGVAYAQKGKLDEAIAVYNKSLSINPNYASAYYNLSQIYYHKRNYELAVQHCNKAINLGFNVNPKFIELLRPYR